MDNHGAGHKVALALPEETKSKSIKLLKNLCWHVNKRGHIPNTRESKSIDHKGPASKGDLTLPPGGKDILHRSDARSPVDVFL